MVYVRDTDGIFEAPLEDVWSFVGSGDSHSSSHDHHAVRRERHSENSGTYSWDQSFDGANVRFSMRWTSHWPLGIAYDVLEGPFLGSKFFLIYEPRGRTTAVHVFGEFVSPTLAPSEIEAAVHRFFEKEFQQDREALRRRVPDSSPPTRPRG